MHLSVDGNQFENAGFRKGWRLVYHVINPNPQELTQAFLPPLIVAVLNFSGVVWTGPYLACKQAHCHAREQRSPKRTRGEGEEVPRKWLSRLVASPLDFARLRPVSLCSELSLLAG